MQCDTLHEEMDLFPKLKLYKHNINGVLKFYLLNKKINLNLYLRLLYLRLLFKLFLVHLISSLMTKNAKHDKFVLFCRFT